jgi:hypothetical protein
MTYLGDATGELSLDQLRYHGLWPDTTTRKDSTMTDDSDEIRIYGARIRVDYADPYGARLQAPELALTRLTVTDPAGMQVAVLLDSDGVNELAERLLRADHAIRAADAAAAL